MKVAWLVNNFLKKELRSSDCFCFALFFCFFFCHYFLLITIPSIYKYRRICITSFEHIKWGICELRKIKKGFIMTLSRDYSRKWGHACYFSEKGQKRAKYLKTWVKWLSSLMHATIASMKHLKYALRGIFYAWNYFSVSLSASLNNYFETVGDVDTIASGET